MRVGEGRRGGRGWKRGGLRSGEAVEEEKVLAGMGDDLGEAGRGGKERRWGKERKKRARGEEEVGKDQDMEASIVASRTRAPGSVRERLAACQDIRLMPLCSPSPIPSRPSSYLIRLSPPRQAPQPANLGSS